MNSTYLTLILSDDSLKRRNKPFGGLISDIKRRYPLYISDIKDGLNVQCLASIVFVYFGCVAGNIAFGGLMGKLKLCILLC